MLRVLSMMASLVCILLASSLPLHAETAPAAPRQLILAIAPNTETFTGTIRLFHRNDTGPWIADAEPWPVLFGKKGLAWGRGLHPAQPGLQKAERDGRSPAGRFRIGFALGNEPQLPPGAQWTYHAKSPNDAWIEDPTLPNYNHLVTVPANDRPAWFDKQRLKLDDPAYHWLLVIEHNYPDSVPGAGSAIFFHVRRGEFVPTAGCTTMPQERLEQILRWLHPAANPQFVLLAQADYDRLWKSWDLPSPPQFGASKTYSYDLFAKAFTNYTTAPNFVLITVVNDKTKETRQICTEAPFLQGAVQTERQISYKDGAGLREVDSFILAQKDRVFHFTNPQALKNIEPYYNDKILNEVREALKPYSEQELRNGFTGEGKEPSTLFDKKSGREYAAYQKAMAHVLLERGLLPRRGCVAGIITIDP